MSTLNTGGTEEFTQDEQILHHYAAMVKKDLEEYHAYPREHEYLRVLLIKHLVRIVLLIRFYQHSQAHPGEIDEIFHICPQRKSRPKYSCSPAIIEPYRDNQCV
jgi:hypothetical protein